LTLGRKLNSKWDDSVALRWLGESSIPLDERVDRLSLGQQALVALALCVGKVPDLLVLDEPVASLDPLARRLLLEMLLASVADRGTTVFISSHIISELEPVCDHLIILSASNVRVAGSIEWLLANHRILVGRRDEALPSNVEVISTRGAERQRTTLVRGGCASVDASWQVLEPDLEEIVLAYLASPVMEPPAPDRSLTATREEQS
jgi:ABC-2 type transport system ATP-binding protein